MNKLAIINLTTKLNQRTNEYFEIPLGLQIGSTFEANNKQFLVVTREQAVSFQRVLDRQGAENFVKVFYDSLCGCLIAEFRHIFIGIELDGYAHS